MILKKYETEFSKAGFTVAGDLLSNWRGDVVAQIDPYGDFHCHDDEVLFIMEEADKKAAKKAKKAAKVEADD